MLFINSNISTDSYITLPVLSRDITAVHFQGEHSFTSIFNIYNDGTHNDTLTLFSNFLDLNAHLAQPTESEHMLWLSDFNWHHPIWEDEANDRLFNADDFIQPLSTLLYRHDMILALPKGLPMYKTTAGNWT